MSWAVASLALLALALAAQLVLFERGRPSTRSLALVAALAGLAVAGRLAFAPLPNVKPTTDIVLIAGFALGASPGFAVGAITALVSNMAFGQGPWTPWQMLAWGLVGVGGALLARLTGGNIGRWRLAAAGALAGLLFGTVMDVSQWLLYGGQPEQAKLIGFMVTSLPWNIAHAAGNAAFALAFGPALIAAVTRARRRLEPVWLPRGTPLAAVSLPAVLALVAFASPQPADEGSSPARSASGSPTAWLLSAQNLDGGFGNDRGASSAPMTTAWAALGLAASGRDLNLTSRRDGLTVIERLRMDAHTAGDPGSVQRLVLAAVAGGADPASFGGRNLVAQVERGIGPSGAVRSPGGGPATNLTAFAVLALAAAGRGGSGGAGGKAVDWLLTAQQPDGGFGIAGRNGPKSDVDSTAAAIQALVSVGRFDSGRRAKALAFLKRSRGSSGGYPAYPGGQVNAQSTAWAVQALVATGGPTERPLRWLRSMIGSGGKVSYAAGQFQTPVWVTAQAMLALAGKSFPLAASNGSGSPTDSGDASGSIDVDGVSGSGSGAPASGSPQDKALAEAKARALAKGKRILRAKRIATSAAITGAAVVGAFVDAFAGPTR
ncbi:MAG: prenyltransferase/squalene oxidase repeat-containing protein [Actinomycetes bacterium]